LIWSLLFIQEKGISAPFSAFSDQTKASLFS
jgi:hypothetical protein